MLTEEQVRQALMRGAVTLRLSGPGADPLSLPLMIAGQELYSDNPYLRRKDARAAIHQIRDAYRAKFNDPRAESLKSDYQRFMDLYEVAHSLPGQEPALKFAAAAIGKAFERIAGSQVDLAARGLNALASSEQGYAYWNATHNRLAETVDTAIFMASVTDSDGVSLFPEYAAFWNETHGVDWNLGIDASTASLLEDPRLATLNGVAELRGETGEIRRDIENVIEQAEATGGALDRLLEVTLEIRREGIESTRATNALQQQFDSYIAAEEDRKRREAEELTAAEDRQLRLAAVSAGASVLGALLGHADPVLGRRVEGVVRAGVQAAEAISTFAQSAARLGAVGVGLAGAALTGNLLGAAMSVISLFSATGPSPTTLVLEGISKVREDLNDFRIAVADRFDRVDKVLNAILETTIDGLNRVDLQLAQLTTTVDAIDRRFIEVQAQLGRFEGTLVELLRDLARQDLEQHLSRLGHERTYGVPLPYEGYVEAVGGLHRWATIEARKSFAVGPSDRSLASQDIHVELNRGTLSDNLNFVSDLLSARWGLGFRAGATPLANPVDWVLARNAYTQLMQESPAHARRVSAVQAEEIDAVGRELIEALASIARRPSPDGGRTINHELFEKLHKNYLTAAAELRSAIESRLLSYEQEKGFLPFRGRDQDPWNMYLPHAPTPSLPQTIPFTFETIGLHIDQPKPEDARELPFPPFSPSQAFPAIVLMAHRVARARGLSIYNDFSFSAVAWWSPFSYGPTYDLVGSQGNKNDMTVRLVVSVAARVGNEDYLVAKYVAPQDEPLQEPPSVAGHNKNMYKKLTKTVTERWSGLSPVLANSGVLLPSLVSLPEFVRRSLPNLGVQFYKDVAEQLRTGDLRHLADTLSGAADLWCAVLELGLPALVSRDEYVRALVHGDDVDSPSPEDSVARGGGEGILAGAGVAAWFEAAAYRLESKVTEYDFDRVMDYRDCASGPFLDIDSRASGLAGRIHSHMELLEQTGAVDEQPILRAALLSGRIAEDSVRSATPPSS